MGLFQSRKEFPKLSNVPSFVFLRLLEMPGPHDEIENLLTHAPRWAVVPGVAHRHMPRTTIIGRPDVGAVSQNPIELHLPDTVDARIGLLSCTHIGELAERHDDHGGMRVGLGLVKADPGIQFIEGRMTGSVQGLTIPVLPALNDRIEKVAFQVENQPSRHVPPPSGNLAHARMTIPDLRQDEIDFPAQFLKPQIVHDQVIGQHLVKACGENHRVFGNARIE